MAVLKKYDLSGSEIGEVAVDDASLQSAVNGQTVKDYLVALRANARQWTAHTKTRPEVSHSGKKPHPQKGTGRARQGYLGAPQYKGGGRVHTPRTKFDQHVSVNRKEKRAVMRHLVIEKVQGHNVHVLQLGKLDSPKTKTIADFLKKLTLNGKRVLFLGDGLITSGKDGAVSLPGDRHDVLVKSLRNIPKVDFALMSNVSGYEIVISRDLVVLDSAVDQLKMLLGG